MTIVKKKAKKRNYSVIDNTGAQDRRMSWQATGLWTWFMTKPDDWEVSLENLCSSKTNGKDSTLSTLAELERLGYLVYQRWRDSSGRFQSAYTIFESPEDLEEWRSQADPGELKTVSKVSNPRKKNHCGKPTAGNPLRGIHCGESTAGNPPQPNIDIQSTELLNTELQIPLISPQGEGEEESVDEVVREVEVVEEEIPTPSVAPLSPNKSAIARKNNSGKEPSSAARFLIEKSVQERLLTQWEAGELQTPLPREQHAFLAHEVMGDYIRAYRKSGTLKSANPNDYDPEFIEHCANKHLTGQLKGSLAKARAMIRRKEQDPYTWGELLEYVQDWMAAKEREVFDEEGNPVTGLAAECAEAIATNSLLQTILEIDLND